MPSVVESLLAQALHLSTEDRSALAVRLFESLTDPEDAQQVTAAWEKEIAERVAEADAGDVPGVSWEQVRTRLGI